MRPSIRLAIFALALSAAPCWALPTGTFAFSQTSGVVTPSEAVEVWLTLTLAPTSEALRTDSAANVISGIDPADYSALDPTGAPYTAGTLNIAFYCMQTFGADCTSGPPYSFVFATGPASLVTPVNLDIEPGESRQFLFGTFIPTVPSVPDGTYVFYNASLDVNAIRADGTIGGNVTVFATCPTFTADCAFTRTVEGQAVPEPGTPALLIASLGGLFGWYRKRNGATNP